MKPAVNAFLFVAFSVFVFSCAERADVTPEAPPAPEVKEWAIAIHGGAGNFSNTSYSQEEEQAYRSSLSHALERGRTLLESGADAVDVVVEVITLLEDDSLFNAGRGAVMTADGTHELDASIMDGASRNAGAAAKLRTIKNPIKVARLIMDVSPHVFLSGNGADNYASQNGLTEVSNSYFTTSKAKRALDRALGSQKSVDTRTETQKMGTVGCVVLDRNGNLSAGTSTGGMTAKKNGRIGDSPIIGAGTYAENGVCAVSSTGHGEYFIRAAVAHDIAARMKYGKQTLLQAAKEVVEEDLVNLGGSGGVIALDYTGEIALIFNSGGMFRASQTAGGDPYVAMYGNE